MPLPSKTALLLSVCISAAAAPQEIVPGVFRIKDTANVYAIVQNHKALLIDFGSGKALDELKPIGNPAPEWILHTHFHRDQAQGDGIAKSRGIRIAVPESERKYFDAVEKMWAAKNVFVLYDMRNEFFALRQNVPVDRGLKAGDVFEWEGLRLQALSAAGHTEGQLSYLLELGGKKLLFCGDAVSNAGKIPTLHDLEWPYVGSTGILAQMRTLNAIRALNPDMLLPSHGELSAAPLDWIPQLNGELAKLDALYDWIPFAVARPRTELTQVLPHLWHYQFGGGGGTAAILLADSKHALLLDCNMKDVPRVIESQARLGFTTIDAVVPSHYHEDHIGGFNAIKSKYGSQVWAMEHMVDVLEHPAAYNLPCLWPEPIHVDRHMRDGEVVNWEGYRIQFFFLPGQTEYTEGVLIEIDGKKILFDGDNLAPPLPGRPLLGHYVSRNYQRLDGGMSYVARKMIELKPDFIAPFHFEMIPGTDENLRSFLASTETFQNAVRAIVDQPDPQIGIDNNWLSAYPYQSDWKLGQTGQIELRLRNWIWAESKVQAAIKAPEGWKLEPAQLSLTAPSRGTAAQSFRVTVPHDAALRSRRFVLTFDTVRDGVPLGEVTEALINIDPLKAH